MRTYAFRALSRVPDFVAGLLDRDEAPDHVFELVLDVQCGGALLPAEAVRAELERPCPRVDPLRVQAWVDDRLALLDQAELVDDLSVDDRLGHGRALQPDDSVTLKLCARGGYVC